MNQKIYIITDNDLDGAGSVLFLKWLYEKNGFQVDFSILDENNPANTINSINFNYYNTVFIVDSYIPNDLKSKVDLANVIVVDHHKDHYDERDNYKICKKIIKESYSSCAKLLYDTFKGKIQLDKHQLALIALIDDYDNYTLKLPYTLALNSVYKFYTGNKVEKFIADFKNGFNGFNDFQKNAISLYNKKFVNELKNPIFEGKIGEFSVVSMIGNFAINELAHYLLKKYNKDVCIIVNTERQYVSFRRQKECNCKLNVLAEKLCNGGGHEYASGGKITDTFLKLTEKFSPITVYNV